MKAAPPPIITSWLIFLHAYDERWHDKSLPWEERKFVCDRLHRLTIAANAVDAGLAVDYSSYLGTRRTA